MRFLFSFFSPPHRFYVSLPPRRKDEDTQRSNFNRKIVNRKIVNITMILFFRTPSKSVIAVECNHELPQADSDKLCWLFGEATPESEDNLKGHFVGPLLGVQTP
jgi:phosphoribosylformylglycinamidine synthase